MTDNSCNELAKRVSQPSLSWEANLTLHERFAEPIAPERLCLSRQEG